MLLVKLQSLDFWPETKIAQALQSAWGRSYTVDQLVQEVRTMSTMGSRYRNIDRELGPGSYLLLGKDFAESR